MSSSSFFFAEDFFQEAWDYESLDRDFSKSPKAQQIYGEKEPSGVEHFILPEQMDDQDNAYVYQSIPEKLFIEDYRRELEDTSVSPDKRLENAIQKAENAGAYDDAELIQRTKKQLEDMLKL